MYYSRKSETRQVVNLTVNLPLSSEKRAVLEDLPERSTTGTVLRNNMSSLAPGCSIEGTDLVCLQTSTFRTRDELVVQLVGVDGSFDPESAARWCRRQL